MLHMSSALARSSRRSLLLAGVALAVCSPAHAQYMAGGGTATDTNGIAIGSNATSNGVGAIAVGANSAATSGGALAAGSGASASGNTSVAVGDHAQADGTAGTALGTTSYAAGANSTAIGSGAGTGSQSTNSWNTAVGAVAGQYVDGQYNNAFGVSAGQYVTGNYNTGVGPGAGVYVVGDGNYAAGLQAGQYVQGNANIAIGYNAGKGSSSASLVANSSVSIGSNAQASANNAIALGRDSQALYADSIAVGSASTTAASASAATGYLTGNAAPGSEVSIGDAANGVTRRLTNLADGADATDAVTVSQLTVVNDKTETLGAATAQALGGGSTFAASTGALSAPVYSIGGTSYTGVENTFTALDTIAANQGSSLATVIGGGTTYTAATGSFTGGSFQAGTGGGTYSTIAAALAAIPTGAGSDSSAVHYDDATHGSVTLNPGGSAATLTNVADGSVASGSTDAVNGGQLDQVSSQVTTNTGDIANLSSGIANGTIGLVQQIGGAPGNGQITIGAATGGTSISIAGTAGDRVLSGVAAGVAANDAVNVAQLTAAIGTASANSVQYDDATHGSVTFNPGGSAAALHNVAAGTVSTSSTDAVNGSQLYATNVQVAANSVQIATQSNQIAALDNGTAGPFRANNSGGYAAPSAAGVNSVAGGFGASASGANATALGTNALASGNNSVALGYASLDDGRDNVVSVGSAGAERQITNVAAATRVTDAVNLGQLQQGLASTLSSANAYTDLRIAELSFDLDKVRRDAAAGTSAAMALAAMPQAFGAGNTMIAGGFGVYRDQSAFAFSASRAFDNHTVVKMGGTIDSRGTVGAAAGVGYPF